MLVFYMNTKALKHWNDKKNLTLIVGWLVYTETTC